MRAGLTRAKGNDSYLMHDEKYSVEGQPTKRGRGGLETLQPNLKQTSGSGGLLHHLRHVRKVFVNLDKVIAGCGLLPF